MGGGGYNPQNVSDAWMAVVRRALRKCGLISRVRTFEWARLKPVYEKGLNRARLDSYCAEEHESILIIL